MIVWGGYGHHWPWTGINGHTATLWDWLHLLLLPLLLPTVVVPALMPVAKARMVKVAGDEPAPVAEVGEAQTATEPAAAEATGPGARSAR